LPASRPDCNRYAFAEELHEQAQRGAAAEVSVSGEILKGLHGARASLEDMSQYRPWIARIGRKRIEQIVANKHHGAYGRAAEVLGSLAELCALSGEEQEGRELIDEYRNRRFNRPGVAARPAASPPGAGRFDSGPDRPGVAGRGRGQHGPRGLAPVNAALLLFGRPPLARWHPHADIRFFRVAGTERRLPQLRRLVEEGYLRRIGERRAAQYLPGTRLEGAQEE
jgi:hypothetical protein